MPSSLKLRFQVDDRRCQMTGWQVEDQEDCRAYFRNRVAAKLRDSDGSALLQEYVLELGDTGFDTGGLSRQVTPSPRAKDWEIGEAFAEAMLEDHHEGSFPWPTALDKRTPKASLPGPDLVGFHRKIAPRFLFGEIKSSSAEDPRGLVTDADDALLKQISRLTTSTPHQQQLIQWMLVKAKQDPRWLPVLNAALKQYSTPTGRGWIVGILVRGGRVPAQTELAKAQEELVATADTGFDVALMAFYVPFHKDDWVEIVYGEGGRN
jgi:hypothetical protein